MREAASPYWVLVADSGYARIFALQKQPAEFREVKELVSDTRHKLTREIMSDSSGRIANVAGGASSHSMQPGSDAHDLAEQNFCSKLIDILEKGAEKNRFEQLFIIADPKTLGRLRQNMSKSLASRVAAEVNRDLASVPPESLEKRVRAELGWSD